MSKEDMEKWEKIDIRTVDPDKLVCMDDVVIDDGLPREERIRRFVEQAGNPFCYICNGIVVKNSYCQDGPKLEDKIGELLTMMSGMC